MAKLEGFLLKEDTERASEADDLRSVAAKLLDLANDLDGKSGAQPAPDSAGTSSFKSAASYSSKRSRTLLTGIAKIVYATRQRRSQYFNREIFGEPSWDIMLDLFVHQDQQLGVPISNVCLASGVPNTTALRWIDTLVAAGLVHRESDALDRRRTLVSLTKMGTDAMACYFSDLAQELAKVRAVERDLTDPALDR